MQLLFALVAVFFALPFLAQSLFASAFVFLILLVFFSLVPVALSLSFQPLLVLFSPFLLAPCVEFREVPFAFSPILLVLSQSFLCVYLQKKLQYKIVLIIITIFNFSKTLLCGNVDAGQTSTPSREEGDPVALAGAPTNELCRDSNVRLNVGGIKFEGSTVGGFSPARA